MGTKQKEKLISLCLDKRVNKNANQGWLDGSLNKGACCQGL